MRSSCGCCMVCAKVEGETCGGFSNSELYDICDSGLKCNKPAHVGNINGTYFFVLDTFGRCELIGEKSEFIL